MKICTKDTCTMYAERPSVGSEGVASAEKGLK